MIPKIKFYFIGLFFLLNCSFGSDFARSTEAIKLQLEGVFVEIEQARAQIREERIPLSEARTDLERKLTEKRRDVSRKQRLIDNHASDLNSMRTRLVARNEEIVYLDSLLNQYLRSFESRLNLAELASYKDNLALLQQVREDDASMDSDKVLAGVVLLEQAVERLDQLIGGFSTSGEAVTPEGRIINGTHYFFGPFSYFTSKNANLAGLTKDRPGSLRPTLLALGSGISSEVSNFSAGTSDTLPIDVTGGNAILISESRETFIEHLQAGGVIMIPILTLALAAFIVTLWKWFEIAGVSKASPEALAKVVTALKENKTTEASQICQSIGGPVGELLRTAVKYSNEKKEILEELLFEKVLSSQPKLTRLLPFIALTAATAPLLGLLGTVTGMINTFKMITIFGTGDARLLSGGISEALVTTEFGLIIAIPALLAHGLLSRKAKGVIANMEQTAIGFINATQTQENESVPTTA